MDLEILHIRLTAYALGELDAAQRADIERILTESQDARDHVARTKNIAKAIKELLPQNAEDVQPVTPAEYRMRQQSGLTGSHANIPSPFAAPSQTPTGTHATSAQAAGKGLVWLLAGCCALLAVGWLWQLKAAPPAPRQNAAAEDDSKTKARLAEAKQAVIAAQAALNQERAVHAELEAKLAEAQKNAQNTQGASDALEEEKKSLEAAKAQLDGELAYAKSLAAAVHQPFVPTQAQVMLALPASTGNHTLETITDALTQGALPPPDQVDASDLLQSFKYNYAAPPPGQSLPLLACSLCTCPWSEGHVLARITLTAGTQAATLSSLQVEFNPTKVGSWRPIGREVKLENGTAGGQGTGELKAGATLTLLVELIPATDPMAPLTAKRAELSQQMTAAQRQVAAGGDATALAEAKLLYEGLRLDLQELDAKIAATKSDAPVWRYLQPAQPTSQAASGDWLAVTASFTDGSGKAVPTQALLSGAAKPFTDTDADFRLAAAAAAFGMVLHESPNRGGANLELVGNLLRDLPQSDDGVKTLTDLAKQAAEILP